MKLTIKTSALIFFLMFISQSLIPVQAEAKQKTDAFNRYTQFEHPLPENAMVKLTVLDNAEHEIMLLMYEEKAVAQHHLKLKEGLLQTGIFFRIEAVSNKVVCEKERNIVIR